MIELTILMPCLNEEKTVGTCVKKGIKFLRDNKVVGEVLIVDNGSTDKSIVIARTAGARVICVQKKGYGSALKAGINDAYGKYIIMGDSDDSYDFVNLMPFLNELRSGTDFVIGNRFKGGIEKGAMPFLHKYIGNPFLSWLGNVLYHGKIGDYHCGLRGFSKEKMLSLNLQSDGMELASEIVLKSLKSNFKIIELPTTLKKDGRGRKAHLRTFRDGIRHIVCLFKYKFEK